jgi:predicted transposase/invertase (TIGR01784 family)
MADIEEIPRILNEPVFQKAFEVAEVANLRPMQARQYQKSLLDYWSNKAVLDTAFAEGKEEGLAEGELKAKLSIAQQLKAQGLALEIIIQATGLSQAEIEQL